MGFDFDIRRVVPPAEVSVMTQLQQDELHFQRRDRA